MSYTLLGRIHIEQQDYAQAIKVLTVCRSLSEKTKKRFGARARVEEQALGALRYQTNAFIQSGDIDSAMANCNEAESALDSELAEEDPAQRQTNLAFLTLAKRAVCFVIRKQFDEGAETLRVVASKVETDPDASYAAGVAAAACVARLEDNETEANRFAKLAFNMLKQSIDRGFEGVEELANDIEWRSVASRPEFQSLIRESASPQP